MNCFMPTSSIRNIILLYYRFLVEVTLRKLHDICQFLVSNSYKLFDIYVIYSISKTQLFLKYI